MDLGYKNAVKAVRFINALRAQKVKRNLSRAGVELDQVTCSHRLMVRHQTNRALGPMNFSVGRQSRLEGAFTLAGDGVISIGSYCSFRGGVRLSAKTRISIGDHVFAAEDVFITDNDNHPTSPAYRKEMTLTPPSSPSWKITDSVASSPVTIGDNVWLGKSAIVLKGVTIGTGSIVAAGAVVTKDIPPFSIAAGNPAKVVKTIENDLKS